MASDQIEALAGTLALAITAPSDEQAERAVALADQIASGMSEHEVAQAKKLAQKLVDGSRTT